MSLFFLFLFFLFFLFLSYRTALHLLNHLIRRHSLPLGGDDIRILLQSVSYQSATSSEAVAVLRSLLCGAHGVDIARTLSSLSSQLMSLLLVSGATRSEDEMVAENGSGNVDDTQLKEMLRLLLVLAPCGDPTLVGARVCIVGTETATADDNDSVQPLSLPPGDVAYLRAGAISSSGSNSQRSMLLRQVSVGLDDQRSRSDGGDSGGTGEEEKTELSAVSTTTTTTTTTGGERDRRFIMSMWQDDGVVVERNERERTADVSMSHGSVWTVPMGRFVSCEEAVLPMEVWTVLLGLHVPSGRGGGEEEEMSLSDACVRLMRVGLGGGSGGRRREKKEWSLLRASCLRLAHEFIRRDPTLVTAHDLLEVAALGGALVDARGESTLYHQLLERATVALEGRRTLSETIEELFLEIKRRRSERERERLEKLALEELKKTEGKKKRKKREAEERRIKESKKKEERRRAKEEKERREEGEKKEQEDVEVLNRRSLVEMTKKLRERTTCLPQEKRILFDDQRKKRGGERGGGGSGTNSVNSSGEGAAAAAAVADTANMSLVTLAHGISVLEARSLAATLLHHWPSAPAKNDGEREENEDDDADVTSLLASAAAAAPAVPTPWLRPTDVTAPDVIRRLLLLTMHGPLNPSRVMRGQVSGSVRKFFCFLALTLQAVLFFFFSFFLLFFTNFCLLFFFLFLFVLASSGNGTSNGSFWMYGGSVRACNQGASEISGLRESRW